MDKEKTWFHSTGNGTRNQYDWQQIQSCRNAKHRSADEGRTGTNQRTGVKCNVTGSHTGHHSHKQRIKIWQQENLSFFSPLGFRQINHYQLSVDTKPEPVFLYFCHQPPSSRKERHGVEYFFLSPEEFRQRIANNEFLEYEEVYENRFYGTLKAQVEKQLEAGQNVIFDVDVVGGCNIKKYYGSRALSVFIQPPSVEELRKRLQGRGTDAPEVIESRIAKAEFELGFADKFDTVIVNDDLEKAKAEALKVIRNFIEQ